MDLKFSFYFVLGILILIGLVFLNFAYFEQPNEIVECKDCNVILISIDALRADHLGIYNYQRNTSPNIDNFFSKGFVFKSAFSQAPNTLPSHMSMLTGLYSSRHKILPIYDNSSLLTNISLSTKYKTIAEILKIYDYKTQGFYAGSDHMDPRFGFGRGFDNYEPNDLFITKSTEDLFNIKNISNSTEVFDFLNDSKNKKFFLFLHTQGAHDPYLTDPPYDTMFDSGYNGKIIGNKDEFDSLLVKNNISWVSDPFTKIRLLFWGRVNKSDPDDMKHLIALYDNTIRRSDSFFGNFLQHLNSLGLLDHTIIIVTADHGEEFYEHGGIVHEKLYDETIHVPLLIYVPNSKPRIISNQVGLVDITPTVLSILGLPEPQYIDGRSLKFLMENPNSSDPNQLLYSEFLTQRTVRTPEWKLIKTVNQSTSYEFFDLKNDPGEKINLDGKGNPKENELKEILENWEFTMNSTYADVRFLNSTFIGYP